MESQRYVHIVSMNFCLRTFSRKIREYNVDSTNLFSSGCFLFSLFQSLHYEIRVNSSSFIVLFLSLSLFASPRPNMPKNSQLGHIGRRCKRQRHFLTEIEQWTTTSVLVVTICVGKLTVDQSRISQICGTVNERERKNDYRWRDTDTHPRVNIARIRGRAPMHVSVETKFLRGTSTVQTNYGKLLSER